MLSETNRINSVVDSCGSAEGMVELIQLGGVEGRQSLMQTSEQPLQT
jgi:hypothetical protein